MVSDLIAARLGRCVRCSKGIYHQDKKSKVTQQHANFKNQLVIVHVSRASVRPLRAQLMRMSSRPSFRV